MTDGTFVTVEGIDGSGTTSVVEHLEDRFPGAQTTAEPTDRFWTGEVARESFEERDVDSLARYHLFMADRAEHCSQLLRPLLDDGWLVISDRGPDSTRAYQSNTTDLTLEEIDAAMEHMIEPDLTLWLSVDTEVASIRTGDDRDAMEDATLQVKAALTYVFLHDEHDRITRIDANQPLEDVVAEAATAIEKHIDPDT